MERFDRQRAVELMNKARKMDAEFQKTLDKIYFSIETAARKKYGSMTYGPLNFSLATQVANFLKERGFTVLYHCEPAGYEVEIIWEENV